MEFNLKKLSSHCHKILLKWYEKSNYLKIWSSNKIKNQNFNKMYYNSRKNMELSMIGESLCIRIPH